MLTFLNRRIRREGDQMSFASKIAKSIQSLTSTIHSGPSYSFLAAEERKLMLRQQEATKIFEPVPNSMGWKKFGSWICHYIPYCYSHQGKQTTLMRILNFQSTSSLSVLSSQKNTDSQFKTNLEIGWAVVTPGPGAQLQTQRVWFQCLTEVLEEFRSNLGWVEWLPVEIQFGYCR